MGFTTPNVARVYDYLLGGFESYDADRVQAADLLRICPSLGVVALENRYFLARAVAWAARQGVTQFVDLGAGAPVQKARGRGTRGHPPDGAGRQPVSAGGLRR